MNGEGSDFHWAHSVTHHAIFPVALCSNTPSHPTMEGRQSRGDVASPKKGRLYLISDMRYLLMFSGSVSSWEWPRGCEQLIQTGLPSLLRNLPNLGVLVELTSESRKEYLALTSLSQHEMILLNQESLSWVFKTQKEISCYLTWGERAWGRSEWTVAELGGDTASLSIPTNPESTLSLNKQLFSSIKFSTTRILLVFVGQMAHATRQKN